MIIVPIILVCIIKKTSIGQNSNINQHIVSGIVIVVFTLLFGKILQGKVFKGFENINWDSGDSQQ